MSDPISFWPRRSRLHIESWVVCCRKPRISFATSPNDGMLKQMRKLRARLPLTLGFTALRGPADHTSQSTRLAFFFAKLPYKWPCQPYNFSHWLVTRSSLTGLAYENERPLEPEQRILRLTGSCTRGPSTGVEAVVLHNIQARKHPRRYRLASLGTFRLHWFSKSRSENSTSRRSRDGNCR
jgi:hypothetical protein